MNRPEYPDNRWLRWWIDYLKKSNNTLKLKLPLTDDGWDYHMLGLLELIQQPYYTPEEVYHKAAVLFYKIIKDHKYIDGNKRSAVVIVYLFFVINDCMLLPSINLRELAKKVAESKPRIYRHQRDNQDRWVKKLEKEFRKHTHTLYQNPS
jgi:death-on-curing family protein